MLSVVDKNRYFGDFISRSIGSCSFNIYNGIFHNSKLRSIFRYSTISSTEDITTRAIMTWRKVLSGIFLRIFIPINPPNRIKGIAKILRTMPDQVRLCHTNACRGTFVKLRMKINHADVAVKVILSSRLESMYTESAGPAAFPIMVEKPRTNPKMGAYHFLDVRAFCCSMFERSTKIIMPTPKRRHIPMHVLKVLSSIKLPNSRPESKPISARGRSFLTSFHRNAFL